MTAKTVDEVSASLSRLTDSISKDVYSAEGGLSSQTPMVFKEEAVEGEELEGKPEEHGGGKNVSVALRTEVVKDKFFISVYRDLLLRLN